jgi:hypothetical protein
MDQAVQDRPLKMRSIGCPETSVTSYQSILRNVSLEHRYRNAILQVPRSHIMFCNEAVISTNSNTRKAVLREADVTQEDPEG